MESGGGEQHESADWEMEETAGVGVAFFATAPGWVLKCISFWHLNLPYFKKSICWQV